MLKFTILILSLHIACSNKETDTEATKTSDTAQSSTDTADTDTSDTDTDTNTGSLPERNSCESADDCNCSPCVQVGDAKVCQFDLTIWFHDCNSVDPYESECCSDANCHGESDGFCAAFDVGYCGGPAPMEANICRYHECGSDDDCTGICLPAGVLGTINSTCLNTGCSNDSDCTDGNDGQCALLYNSPTCPEAVLSCVYTDAECRRAEGCDNGDVCVADSSAAGGASCQELMPPAK